MKNKGIGYIIFTVTVALSTICASKLNAQTFTKLIDPAINSKPGDWRSATPIDIDNNYTLDIIAGNGNFAANRLFINLGDSSFSDSSQYTVISQSGFSASSFWADVDNDCDMDALWASANSGSHGLFINQGNGVFSKITSGNLVNNNTNIHSACWFDYNGDGNIDLFTPSSEGDTNYLYQNNGNLSFTRIDTGVAALTKGRFWSVTPSDFDNDGDMDIFLASRASGGVNHLLKNNGNGWFTLDTNAAMANNADSVQTSCWGDYNNDGYQDLFLARRGRTNLLYKNNGDGTFTSVSAGALTTNNGLPGSAIWGDFDNDGFLDLYLARVSSSNNSNILYRNNGNGTFNATTAGSLGSEWYSTEGCNVGDFNNDGFLDIMNANRFSKPISVFTNNGNNNNYIKLGLFGSSSNKASVGAKAVIKTSAGTQIRELSGTIGWRMQQGFEIHFGLGQDTIVDTLRIFWPGGGTCTLTNVPANGFYNIGQLTCSLDSVPHAEFTDSSRFLTAHFTNLSGGAVSGYEWDFGDGQTSTQTNPVHHYTQAGKYEVTLKVFDNFCKSITIKDSIEICPDTAQLGFYTSHQGTAITFNDTSISHGYDFQWDFGDGNTGTDTVANHTYAMPGTYNVCLFVTDSCRIDTICQTITVCSDTITAAFGHTNSVLNVSFIDSSVNATSIVWDFGDGNTSTATNPSHTYAAPGYYTVCQTAMDNCTSTTTCKTIGVCLDTAIANFSYSDTLNTITLTSTSQNANTYLWDFGDGNLSTNLNPTHTYQQYGTYTVCLTVSNDCYTDTICQSITICPVRGVSNYAYQHVGQSLAVQFQSKASNAQSYLWDFGDGGLSSNKNQLYVYSRAWVYNVCLTITDTCGKTDTHCKNVNMLPFSIDEISILESIKVYPNPATDVLQIELPGEMKSGASISLYDINGKLLIAKTTSENQETITLDLNSISKGVYLLDLHLNGASRQVKIVKN